MLLSKNFVPFPANEQSASISLGNMTLDYRVFAKLSQLSDIKASPDYPQATDFAIALAAVCGQNGKANATLVRAAEDLRRVVGRPKVRRVGSAA